jgi:replicative DNA helicase
MLDIPSIKRAASGRWVEILSRIGGIDPQLLDGKHHPCPKCGGTDRFRLIDAEDGALFCNGCFSKGNGDGIAAVVWLTGLSFVDALARIAEEVGVTVEHRECDVIQEMAWRKGVTAESLKAYGAITAKRGTLTVCRVPMHDADGLPTGSFDLAPTGEYDKGKTTQGSKHGLFAVGLPKEDDIIAVVEGVKDAAALHALGIQAVGLPTCRMDAEFARFFRGCHAVVVPDRDKAGLEGAEETASRLFGVAASVKVAELPADYKETGGADVRDVLRTRDGERKVREAIVNAREWMPKTRSVASKLVLLPDVLAKFIDDLGTGQPLLKLGLPNVDDAIGGGAMPGEMVIVAGRPSHGKTAAGMQALESLSQVVPVLMISEEMSAVALAQRTLCGITLIDPETWTAHKQDLHRDSASHFGPRKTYYIAESCGTVDKAVEVIAEAREKHNIGAVVIDYVQLLRGHGQGRYEQVSDVSTRLKQAAVRYGIVLLALCQLNRQIETRTTTKGGNGQKAKTTCPRMSDLRDCVTGDTRVALADGTSIPIAELADKEPVVLTMNHDGRLVATRSDMVWRVGRRHVLTIRTRSGRTISVTHRHRLLTGKGWTQAGRIRVGERLAIARRLPEIVGATMKEHELILLAHLIGDGSYLTHQPLRYTTGNDECSRAVTTAAKMFGSAVTVTRYDYKPGWHQLVIAGNGNRWHAAGVGKWLKDIGVWNQRSKDKHIPDCVFRIPQQQLALFMRHLWATDGCIHINRRGNKTFACTHFATASEQLASDVAFLLLRFGIVARISKRHKDGVISVVVSGVNNLRRFANDIGAFGDRQKQLVELEEWLCTANANTNVDTLPIEVMDVLRTKMSKVGMSQRDMCSAIGVAGQGSRFRKLSGRGLFLRYADALNCDELRQMATSDVFWDSVESISDGGVQDVYDLTVPGHANWLGNGGIVTHNSGQLEQDADVILFVEWLHKTSPDAHLETEYRILVAKNRNRPIKRSLIECVFRAERQRLYPLEKREGYKAPQRSPYAEFDAFAD